MSKVVLDGWQEKSKHSHPPCISKTTLPQPRSATHARYCPNMQEAAESREGVVVIADPRQVLALLLAPLSAPYGGGRVEAGWQAGRLVGCHFILPRHTRGGVGRKGGMGSAAGKYVHPHLMGAAQHCEGLHCIAKSQSHLQDIPVIMGLSPSSLMCLYKFCRMFSMCVNRTCTVHMLLNSKKGILQNGTILIARYCSVAYICITTQYVLKNVTCHKTITVTKWYMLQNRTVRKWYVSKV
jgi:hypothetical protein